MIKHKVTLNVKTLRDVMTTPREFNKTSRDVTATHALSSHVTLTAMCDIEVFNVVHVVSREDLGGESDGVLWFVAVPVEELERAS